MRGEEKLRHYLDRAFYGISQTERIQEEKEALLAELMEKYQVLLDQGYEPESAYQAVISGIGDIFELVDGIVGDKEPGKSSGKEESQSSGAAGKDLSASKFESRFSWLMPYGAAGIFFILWIGQMVFPAGPKERTVLPLLLFGAAAGAVILWLICCWPRPSSFKAIPISHLAMAAVWCIAALLFLRAAVKPHLAKVMWLIPLGALAITQLISLWTEDQDIKKRSGHHE